MWSCNININGRIVVSPLAKRGETRLSDRRSRFLSAHSDDSFNESFVFIFLSMDRHAEARVHVRATSRLCAIPPITWTLQICGTSRQSIISLQLSLSWKMLSRARLIPLVITALWFYAVIHATIHGRWWFLAGSRGSLLLNRSLLDKSNDGW